MKNIIIILSLVVFAFGHNVSKSFTVEGLTCDYGCVNKVKSVVTALEGVQSCDVDYRQKKMTVVYNSDKLNSENIISSLDENTTFTTNDKIDNTTTIQKDIHASTKKATQRMKFLT